MYGSIIGLDPGDAGSCVQCLPCSEGGQHGSRLPYDMVFAYADRLTAETASYGLRLANQSRHGGLSLMVRAAVCGTAYSGSTPGVHPWVPYRSLMDPVRIRHVMPP